MFLVYFSMTAGAEDGGRHSLGVSRGVKHSEMAVAHVRRRRGSVSTARTSPERVLGILGHGIALVQDDELDAGAEDPPRARKLLDLLPHDSDSPVIGRVQLKRHVPIRLFTVQLLRHGKNGGRFARARGAVQQQVRQAVRRRQLTD